MRRAAAGAGSRTRLPAHLGPPLHVQTEIVETDYDADFLRHIFPRLEWPALVAAAAAVGAPPLPPTVTDAMLAGDDAFLRAFHHALLEVTLQEGALVCPATGRRFPVEQGIPNMLLTADET
jgi:multifunctional methyltransferase subunit TRM112